MPHIIILRTADMKVTINADTLYLPIKQVYFDEILAGVKSCEYREIKEGITANRYLLRDSRALIS